tara:strand:+ start:144 stop:707 length:564 start_codon:yes stop_codon:yes gene_type:complete
MALPINLTEDAKNTFDFFMVNQDQVTDSLYARAIEGLNLNESQKNAIQNKFSIDASGTRFDQTTLDLNKSFAESAAHGFIDPIKKTADYLQNIHYGAYDNEDQLYTETVQNARILQNTIDNIKTLSLGNQDIRISMQSITLQSIQKVFSHVIDTLEEQDQTRDRTSIPDREHGMECIAKINPEDLSL